MNTYNFEKVLVLIPLYEEEDLIEIKIQFVNFFPCLFSDVDDLSLVKKAAPVSSL